MPEVISNTSCLIILDNIDRLDILQILYQTIHITEEVAQEFGKPLANWMMVNVVRDKNYLRLLNTNVDLGEASTIALAVQMLGNPVMILDDLKARKLAKQLELKYTGLLGILLKAKQQKIIVSVSDILVQLRQVNFRFSEKLETEVLKLAGEL
jgi:Predicted nucleic acid-binding protein, contains PIN domain